MLSKQTGIHDGGGPSLIEKSLSFILGLSVTTGVIYVFTIGNTPVYIGCCVAALAFAMLCLSQPEKLVDAVVAVDKSVLAFCGMAALSIVPALAYAIFGNLGIDAPITVLKGLIVLAAGIIIYLVTIALRENRNTIMCGVAAGVAVNIVFSIVANVAFNSGSVFSLFSWFPQDAFVVPLQWGVPEPGGSHPIYTYRAQGLFLEPSHLMVFLIAWGILCSVSMRQAYAKVALMIGVAYISVQALSPNIGILILEAALLIITHRHFKHGKLQEVRARSVSHTTIITIVVMLFFAVLSVMLFWGSISGLLDSVITSLGDLNVMSSADTGTAARFEAMMSTLSLLPSYLFGSGWNTESLVLTAHFGSSIFASHSFALRLLLEIGPLGLLSYCWVIWRHAVAVYRTSTMGRLVAVSIVCMALAQFMNGITLLPYVWLLLGISRGLTIDGNQAEKCACGAEARGGRA